MSYDPTQPASSPQGNPSQPFFQPGVPPGAQPPYAPVGGAVPPAPARASFWRTLELPGQTALIAGAALLILFFLPWFSTPDFKHIFDFINRQQPGAAPTISYSGWNAARGEPTLFALSLFSPDASQVLFPELWLVLPCALALVLTAVLLGLRRLSRRAASGMLIFIGVLLLLLELAFVIQFSALQTNFQESFGPRITIPVVYSALWAFWLSVVASVATLLIGGYAFLQRRPSAGSVPGSAPGAPNARSGPDGAGVTALVSGLVLLISFFLPWFSMSATCSGAACSVPEIQFGYFASTSSASAFTLAGPGVIFFSILSDIGILIFSPASLWLVLLASVAFIAAASCMLRGMISSGQGRVWIIVIAALALLVEVIYLFNAFGAFSAAKQHASGVIPTRSSQPPFGLDWMFTIATGPAFGFWVGLVATIAAGVGALLIRRPGLRVGTAPAYQPPQFSGAPPIQWPQPAQGPAGLARGTQRPGLPGLAALIVGLAMLICFFLPWLTTPDFSDPHKVSFSLLLLTTGQTATPPTSLHSGWDTVNGVLLFDPSAAPVEFSETFPLHLFPQFWLILPGALALLVIAWLFSSRRLSARSASALLFSISLTALLLELGLPLQVQALQTDLSQRLFNGVQGVAVPVLFAVAWGFWLSVAVSAAGVVLGGFSLLQRKRPITPGALKGG